MSGPILRPETLTVLENLVDAKQRHGAVWREVADNRRAPTELRRTENQLWHEFHNQALEARAYAEQNPEAMEADRIALMQLQVQEQHQHDLHIKTFKGDEKQTVHSEWNSRRVALLYLTEAAMIAAGWPHIREEVQATATYTAPSGKKDEPFGSVRQWSGKALYEGEGDIYRTMHSIRPIDPPLPRSARQETLSVHWKPVVDARWGMADSAGSIPMVLASAPERPLVVPLPRFPNWKEAGLKQPTEEANRATRARSPEKASAGAGASSRPAAATKPRHIPSFLLAHDLSAEQLSQLPFGDPLAMSLVHQDSFGITSDEEVSRWTSLMLGAAIAAGCDQWELRRTEEDDLGHTYAEWTDTGIEAVKQMIQSGKLFDVRLSDWNRCSYESPECGDAIVGGGIAHDNARVCDPHNNVTWALAIIKKPVMKTREEALEWLARLHVENTERRSVNEAAGLPQSRARAEWATFMISLLPTPTEQVIDDGLFALESPSGRPAKVALQKVRWPGFTSTPFHTAEEKTATADQILRFVDSGFPRKAFTKAVYTALKSMYGFSAHTDGDGFYHRWFSTPAAGVEFLEHIQSARPGMTLLGDPAATYSDVERALATALKTRGYLELQKDALRQGDALIPAMSAPQIPAVSQSPRDRVPTTRAARVVEAAEQMLFDL